MRSPSGCSSIVLLLLWSLCGQVVAQADTSVRVDTTTWMDSTRHRLIPIALYHLPTDTVHVGPLAIISHGWNRNLPGTYLKYSYLAERLAALGYLVVSIQHELPGDEPLAMGGDLFALRAPNRERGAATIAFVIDAVKHRWPTVGQDRTILIGHSNGGDMSVLFAERHPEAITELITLDNRRVPLPRMSRPRILSLRSSDAPPDPGVLPTVSEQARYGIVVVPLANVKHHEMSDRADPAQRELLLQTILRWLDGR